MRRVLLTDLVALLLGLVFGVVGASAAEVGGPGPVPPAFVVPATNGYTAELAAGAGHEGGSGGVILTMHRGGNGVTYLMPAVVTETSIEGHFGALGEVDVHLVATGGRAGESSGCGGGPVKFSTGRWEGTIRFRGEEGFASIDASSAKAAVKPFLRLVCFEEVDEGMAGHSPGARLDFARRHGTESLSLTVRKNKRVGPTSLRAELSERQGKMQIDRTVTAHGSSSAFEFEIPPGRASVESPAPFSGALHLTRRPGSSPRVSGDLKVDFPGRAGVPVLGPGKVRASLVRAVLNPSHPF